MNISPIYIQQNIILLFAKSETIFQKQLSKMLVEIKSHFTNIAKTYIKYNWYDALGHP